MSWQEVDTDIGGAVGRCKYSVSLKHGGARVSVPKALVETLGWTKATRLRLLVGAAELAGKLRLEPFAAGKIAGRPAIKGGGMLVRLGRWPSLAPRDVDGIAVDHEAVLSALIITLPLHAQAIAPAPRPGPTIAPPPGGKVNVVDKVVGAGPTPPKFAAQSGTRK